MLSSNPTIKTPAIKAALADSHKRVAPIWKTFRRGSDEVLQEVSLRKRPLKS